MHASTCRCPGATHSGISLPLPLAGRVNALCRYSPPAHAGPPVEPEQAVEYVRQAKSTLGDIAAVSITGPGEPMAQPGRTLQALVALRQAFPELALRVSSNGLGLAEHAETLARLNVGLVTLRAHAVSVDALTRLFAWIRPSVRTLTIKLAAGEMLTAQVLAVQALHGQGLNVKVHSLLVPGINDAEMGPLARIMAEAGASCMHVHPFAPFAGAPEDARPPTAEELGKARSAAGSYLEQIDACRTCAGQDSASALAGLTAKAGGPTAERPYVAVATTDGAEVNEHLGRAVRLLIYGAEGGMGRMVGVRQAPEPGGGEERWKKLAETLADCCALLVADAGETPRAALAGHGLQVRRVGGFIEDAVADALGLKGLQRKKNQDCNPSIDSQGD
ncbi:MAG: NifB/NifX family molybdenum-iron cluster-binding protein [Desulfocurvibacter africanus]